MTADGFGASPLWVLEALGGPDEAVRSGRAEDLGDATSAALNVLAVEVAASRDARCLSFGAGLPDALFEHDGQITKRETRAITLSALAPRRGELLWDIGAGSGSVAIEWMLAHPSLRAIAVEARADRAARIARNALAFGVPDLRIVEGAAPDVLAGLPGPDAVFVGGGASDPGVLDAAVAALRGGGRLVANGVTLETQATLLDACAPAGRRSGDDRHRARRAGGRDDRLAAGDAGDAMDLGEAMRVAGIGCREGVSMAEVLAAIEAARRAHGVDRAGRAGDRAGEAPRGGAGRGGAASRAAADRRGGRGAGGGRGLRRIRRARWPPRARRRCPRRRRWPSRDRAAACSVRASCSAGSPAPSRFPESGHDRAFHRCRAGGRRI